MPTLNIPRSASSFETQNTRERSLRQIKRRRRDVVNTILETSPEMSRTTSPAEEISSNILVSAETPNEVQEKNVE